MKTNTSLNFIDVFSGAGGLSCGLELAGHKCLLGVDWNKDGIETFAHNHPHAQTFLGPIQELTTKKLKELTDNKKIHMVVGGPPCQGFSTVGRGNPKDERNVLFKEFCRVVKVLDPQFIIMENVTGMLAKKNENIFRSVLKTLLNLGYNFNVQVLEASKYGVPERRRRTIFLGGKINTTITFPPHSHDTTNENGDYVPPVTLGEILKDLKAPCGSIFNHEVEKANIVSELDLGRLKHIPEGGSIRYERDEKEYLPSKFKMGVDWKKLREGRLRQAKYYRIHRGRPSPTIMTARSSYYHPTEHRYLTPREAAKIQSFPNSFKFFGSTTSQWRQIGNAVPPLLGKALGEWIIHLKNKNSRKKSEKLKIKSLEETLVIVRSTAFVYTEKEFEKENVQ